MNRPNYLTALTIGGSDDVDSFVERLGCRQNAEDLVHSMITNWLHFDQLRRNREKDPRLVEAKEQLNQARVDLAVCASKGVDSARLQQLTDNVRDAETHLEWMEWTVQK